MCVGKPPCRDSRQRMRRKEPRSLESVAGRWLFEQAHDFQGRPELQSKFVAVQFNKQCIGYTIRGNQVGVMSVHRGMTGDLEVKLGL